MSYTLLRKLRNLMGKHKSKFIIVLGMGWYPGLFWELKGYRVAVSLKPLMQNPESVKLVVFTGGEDIHPSLYGGKDRGASVCNIHRDKMEMRIFEACKKHKIKMVGICRGLQFLNVMAGGKMWQHIDNHTPVLHEAYSPMVGTTITVNSYHHQMVEPASGSVPILWAQPKIARFYLDHSCKIYSEVPMEVEAVSYPEIEAFGVQYHPEDMSYKAAARTFFLNMVQAFLSMDSEQFTKVYGGEHGRAQVAQNSCE